VLPNPTFDLLLKVPLAKASSKITLSIFVFAQSIAGIAESLLAALISGFRATDITNFLNGTVEIKGGCDLDHRRTRTASPRKEIDTFQDLGP
jgi:hypothetical protein